jgi:two-component system, NtrC family, sensor kinase
MFTDSKRGNVQGVFSAINHALVQTKRRYQWNFTNSKGDIFPTDVELTGIEIEGDKFVQVVIRDVTEREMAQEALRKANENLELKVQERTEELNSLNSKIGEIARSAGMAEVASGVLHNVGNVLNSVNVSTSLLRSQVKNSKINNLEKLVEMIKGHEEDLCDFLNNDEKGKYVIPFLAGLSEKLMKDQDNQIIELDSLSDNIEHIKNIVTMQQSHTGSMGVIENLRASIVMNDAININLASMGKHGIEVVRAYEDDPEMAVDKHKLIQVLVNLVSNAGHALSNKKNDKRITIGIKKSNDSVVFYVEDNGVGIDKSDIARVFEFGFKKRKGGHGYGLHHSALMVKDLGGKIKVKSDGLGEGARFELIIPIDLA